MTIKIPIVFVLLVLPVALAQNGQIGYHYHAPVVPFQLPSSTRPNHNLQQSFINNINELHNGFLPSPIYSQHYANEVYKNQHSQTQPAAHYNYQEYLSAQSSYPNENYHSYSENFGDSNLLEAQNAQQTIQANPNFNPSYTNTRQQQPVIKKHIYFHLPPPDDSATSTVAIPNALKKTYNIIFIKLPSQKSTSAARLQQLINRQATVENKTLIYVLVKKPETQPIQSVTSKPEVFFVKYKEPRNVAQPVNNGVVQVPAPHGSASPGLLPGQINGHGDK